MTAKTERNAEVWRLYHDEHLTKTALSKLFGVSHTRINQILDWEKRKNDIAELITEGKDLSEYCLRDRLILLFDHLDHEYADALGRKVSSNVLSAVCCLFRVHSPLSKINSPRECLQRFMDISYDELIRIRSVGARKATIIGKIQDEIANNWDYYQEILLKNCIKVKPDDFFDHFSFEKEKIAL